MKAVYGDTDALDCIGVTREEFKKFVEHCNENLFPTWLAEVGAVGGRVEIENEKGFKRIVWLAAKRYMGILDYYKGEAAKPDTKPEVKGLEWKRGDVNLMAYRLQEEIIYLFRDDEKYLDSGAYRAAAEKWRKKVLEGELSLDEVKVAQSLGKELGDYIVKPLKSGNGMSAEPAHVRVARVLLTRGAEVAPGVRIAYYMHEYLTRDVRPAEDYAGECDRYYLWEEKVYPPTQRLLEALFPAEDWRTLKKARPPKPRKPRARGSSDEEIRSSPDDASSGDAGRGNSVGVDAAAPSSLPLPLPLPLLLECEGCGQPIRIGKDFSKDGRCAECSAA